MSTTDETLLDEELPTTDWTLEWERKYKELQADYTRKSQELANLKKTGTQYNEDELEEFNTLVDQRVQVNKEALTTKIKEDLMFEKILESDPDLKGKATAIKELAEAKGLSYEETIEKYWFASSDKLAKAKERSLVGDRVMETKPRTINDLTPEEYAERKQSVSKSNPFTKATWF